MTQHAPEPLKILFLNDNDEGQVFEKGKDGKLRVHRWAEEFLYEDYERDIRKFDFGFLVYEGATHFRPDNWDELTDDQRDVITDSDEGDSAFHSYEAVMIGKWRRATAADLLEVGAIAAE